MFRVLPFYLFRYAVPCFPIPDYLFGVLHSGFVGPCSVCSYSGIPCFIATLTAQYYWMPFCIWEGGTMLDALLFLRRWLLARGRLHQCPHEKIWTEPVVNSKLLRVFSSYTSKVNFERLGFSKCRTQTCFRIVKWAQAPKNWTYIFYNKACKKLLDSAVKSISSQSRYFKF